VDTFRAGQFFFAGTLKGDHYTFDTFESRHIAKVLRKKEGDILYITDGKGTVAEAEIIYLDRNKVKTAIKKKIHLPPPERKLHVYIAPTKSIDRFEWFLEKATELGVWEITPVITKLTERKKINYERLEKIIVSAVKQAKRAYKPTLNPIEKLSGTFEKAENLFIARCKPEKIDNKHFISQQSASVLIGPEGGFSADELVKLKEFPAVLLGENRLRTETAGIASVCLFYSKT
jgi:16S rRNA (uracil1498-N3)-methyltransferase